MRSIVHDLKAGSRGLCPVDCVIYNAENIGVVVRGAGLVSGLEVEYLSCAADEASAAAENVSVLKPTAENECIGLADIEGLGVKLLALDEEVIGNACSDRVRGHKSPHYLALIASPLKVARCADYALEGL